MSGMFLNMTYTSEKNTTINLHFEFFTSGETAPYTLKILFTLYSFLCICAMTGSEKTINRKKLLSCISWDYIFCLHIPETNTLRQTVHDAMQRFEKLQYPFDKYPLKIIHYIHCAITV